MFMLNLLQLTGKVVIVTSAARGLGRQSARALTEAVAICLASGAERLPPSCERWGQGALCPRQRYPIGNDPRLCRAGGA